MCVIIVKPEGETLTRETFRNAWRVNPDGGGYAFIDAHGNLRVRKSLDRKQLWQWWRSDQVNNRNPLMVLHLRIATHGPVSLDNCHPFTVAGDTQTVMFHNGILSCAIPAHTDKRSDSRVFAEDTLRALPAGWQENPLLFALVEDAASGSKIAFLSTSWADSLTVLNRRSWTELDGLLCSNTYGFAPVGKITASTTVFADKGNNLPAKGNGGTAAHPWYGKGGSFKWDTKWSYEDLAEQLDRRGGATANRLTPHWFDGSDTDVICRECGEAWSDLVHDEDAIADAEWGESFDTMLGIK